MHGGIAFEMHDIVTHRNKERSGEEGWGMNANKRLLNNVMQQWLGTQHGLGLILFFWVMLFSLVGGVTMLLVGLTHWNPWWFLMGLLGLRLFAWSVQIGGGKLDRLLSGEL